MAKLYLHSFYSTFVVNILPVVTMGRARAQRYMCHYLLMVCQF